MSHSRRVIVIGGGLAGIAAAVRLADHGIPVTLMEATRRLGGRAASHIDPETGEEIDNCQHVTMGACTAYNALLHRLGVAGAIEWTDSQTWIEPGGRTSIIRPGPLPPPLHYTGSFAAARFLSPLDKLAIAGAAGAIAAANRTTWRDRTFLDFLRHAAQPDSTIRRFWSPIVVSACNLDVDRVSAAPALMVFQNGLLAGPAAARIGIPRIPLARLYDNVAPILERAGGAIHFGRRIAALREDSGTVEVAGPDAEPASHAAAAIVALPPHRVLGVLPAPLRERLQPLATVEHSPIIGIHLRLDRPILAAPHAVLVDRQTQWVFRKDAAGRSLHAVISAAPDDLLTLPETEIARRTWADIVACIPPATAARIIWSRVIKSRLATFAATPAFESSRPPPGLIPGSTRIAIAGDFTQTGWPATMEGATRSGQAAADAILANLL